ncbi:uncharacterized protein LOC131239096 [Magnolia sinica]|uniref:uncharacterized protein LOC131239096 n=1 Tax=Magnolia sinica TaxID=86752 RepID=UPI00265B1E9A|nr:uncharacterized protein LOC131239096 [Magnolia sinica]
METPYPKPINPSQTRVGWIGIGVMGSAMAARLQAAGYILTVYARNPSKAAQLQSHGAHLAASPAKVARLSDVVFTMVGHPSDVRSVYLGEAGILSGLSEGGAVIDHTSSHPALAREIAAAARDKGCWAVDAPVSGGDIGAREGKLAILAGGDCGVVGWLSPLFEIMGKATYVGEPGCGQSCKIANQITVGGNLLGLSEGLVFAERAGIDLRRFLEAVGDGAAGSKAMELFGERMIGRDFRPGGFAEYMLKDLGMGLVGGDGEEEGGSAVLPGAALCKQLYVGMVANGNGKMGHHGLITVIERINGKRVTHPMNGWISFIVWMPVSCKGVAKALQAVNRLLPKPSKQACFVLALKKAAILSHPFPPTKASQRDSKMANGALCAPPSSSLHSSLIQRHHNTLLPLCPSTISFSLKKRTATFTTRALLSSTRESVLKSFHERNALKIISGLQNFDRDNVASVITAADKGGATHVDIACDPELVKLAINITSLPICVSSVDPEAFPDAVEAGAHMVEIGNYDSFYEMGRLFSPDEILKLTKETKRILPSVTLSVTVPHTLSLPDQIKLAELLEQEGADIIQTEGGKCSNPSKPGVLGLIEKATPTLAAAYSISRVVKIPVMCSSGLSAVTAPMALTAGAAGVGVGSAVNKLNDVIAMMAEVKSIAESLGLSANCSNKEMRALVP